MQGVGEEGCGRSGGGEVTAILLAERRSRLQQVRPPPPLVATLSAPMVIDQQESGTRGGC